jgi:2-aminobenzoate-CoA ligase
MSGASSTSLSPSAHVDTFCRDHLPPVDQWPDLLVAEAGLDYPERLNCAVELLDRVIDERGADRPCLLIPGSEAWSYGDLQRHVHQVATVLRDRFGLLPGQRVLLRGPNNPWLVACWLAVLEAGGVVVTTVPLLRAGELTTIAEIARVNLALCDHRFTDDLAAADLGGAPTVVYGGDGPDDLTALAAGAPPGFAAVDTAADDVALLAFTSGTTGRPKATMHFHRDVLAIADTFARHVVRIEPDDVVTGTPPLGFTFGLGGLVVFPMRVGAAMLLLEKVTPLGLAESIEEHRATVCFTAPTAYKAMIAGGAAGKLASLRRGVSAGEHLAEATWHAFYEATGVRLIDGIGSTEMLHVFIGSADDEIRPGSTGRAVPGYQATILDDEDNPAPPGTAGRLAVKGPTGCRYLADPRQASYVQGGWNVTGDVFVQDEDGYFWYRARNDDMIISSGYNIAGPEVEEAVMAHPAVAECAVVGVPDEARGQVVKAFVVPAAGVVADDALVHELQDFVKQRIAPYKYPRVVAFLDALPRTSTGKVQRFVLRDRVASEPAEPVATATQGAS